MQRNYANAVKSKPKTGAAPASDVEQTPSCLLSPYKTDEVAQEDLLPIATGTLSSLRLKAVRPLMIASKNPLPRLSWTDSKKFWKTMTRKEQLYPRTPDIFRNQPAVTANMRTILLDWLIEVREGSHNLPLSVHFLHNRANMIFQVCDVYKLHRETFHLAVDFIDRFLASTTDLHKSQLQLVGTTSLFVAAKFEEIYPPKINEFAYVTDGACTEKDILEQELILLKVNFAFNIIIIHVSKLNSKACLFMLQVLKWQLTPITTNSWLNVFLQLIQMRSHYSESFRKNFVQCQYSQNVFVQVARVSSPVSDIFI